MRERVTRMHDDSRSVTAIVVNYRSEDHVLMLLEDLDRDPAIARIIIVDNASTEASARQFRRAAATRTIPIEVIENRENRGFAQAINQGLIELATDFALIVNPDCRIPQPILPHLLDIMDQEPRVGMLGCRVLNPDGSEQRGDRRYLPDPRRSLYRVMGLGALGLADGAPRGFDLAGAPLPTGPTPVEAISGALMLVRESAVREVGGLDAGYFLHCEDLDWCRRFQDSGWQIRFVPEISIIHAKGHSSAGRPLFVLWHKHRGMWRYYRKFHGGDPAFLKLGVATGIALRFGLLFLIESPRTLFRRGHPRRGSRINADSRDA